MHLVNAVFECLCACLYNQIVSISQLNLVRFRLWSRSAYPSYFLMTTSLDFDLEQSRPPQIFPIPGMLEQRRMNIQGVFLLTLSSCYYRTPLSAALTVDDIVLAGMLLLMISARMLVIDLRGRGRSVGGCSPSDSR